MKDFRDKSVLVTGAASGIGRATALAFAAEGANLIIADINEEGLKSTAKEIERLGRRAICVRTDVSKPEDVAALAQVSIKEGGGVDVLMNNAGVGLGALIRDMDPADWEWIMGINLWGAIYMIYHLLPQMIERGSGHIINLASGAGLVALPVLGAYSTTKFALVGLSGALRAELAHHNIGVSVVCPGVIRTPIFQTGKVKGLSLEVKEVPGWIGITPEKAAKAIIKGVKRNQARIIITPLMKIMAIVNSLLPGLVRAVNSRMARRIEKELRVKDNSGS